MQSSAEEDPTLRFPDPDKKLVAAHTFGDVKRKDNGDLSVQIIPHGFMRQAYSNRVGKKPFPVDPDHFFEALSMHLGTQHMIALKLGNRELLECAQLKYISIASEVSTTLTSKQTKDRYRADRKPDNRRRYLTHPRNLNLPAGFWTWATDEVFEEVREQVRVLNDALTEEKEKRENLEEENEELRKENTTLRTRLEQSEHAHRDEVQSLRREIDALVRANSEKDERIARLQESLSVAVAKIDELEEKLADANRKSFESLKTVFKLGEECKDAHTENAALKNEEDKLRLRLAARAEAEIAQKVELEKIKVTVRFLKESNARLKEGINSVLEEREKRKAEEEKDSWNNAAERLSDEKYLETVHKYLYVKEKFHVSDAAFHEMWMLFQDFNRIPASQDMKIRREEIYKMFKDDKKFNLRQTPNKQGHQVDITAVWERQLVAALDRGEITLEDVAKFKIGGDGTKMASRFLTVTSLTTCLVTTWDSLKAENLDLVACVSGPEKYDVLYEELSDVGRDVDRVLDDGFLEFEYKGEKVKMNVEVFVCSDYKFLLMLVGMKAANSNHPCVWCRLQKNCPKTGGFQNLKANGEARTLAFVLAEGAKGGAGKDGCDKPPVFRRIPIENYFLDPLHFDLRVHDHLMGHLIAEVRSLDGSNNCNKESSKGPMVKALEAAISAAAGVPGGTPVRWQLRPKENSTKEVEESWLSADQKRRVITSLSGKLSVDMLGDVDRVKRHQILWDAFAKMHNTLKLPFCLGEFDLTAYEDAATTLCNSWIKVGLSAAGQHGESTGHVPPYMHCAYKHVPRQLRRLGSQRIVTCQAIERFGDLLKTALHRTGSFKLPTERAFLILHLVKELVKLGAGRATRWTKDKAPAVLPQTAESMRQETTPLGIMEKARACWPELVVGRSEIEDAKRVDEQIAQGKGKGRTTQKNGRGNPAKNAPEKEKSNPTKKAAQGAKRNAAPKATESAGRKRAKQV